VTTRREASRSEGKGVAQVVAAPRLGGRQVPGLRLPRFRGGSGAGGRSNPHAEESPSVLR
jgi:hypothetical protein